MPRDEQARSVVSICHVRPPGGEREALLPTDRSPRPYEGLSYEHATPSTSRTSLDPLSVLSLTSLNPFSLRSILCVTCVSSTDTLPRDEKHRLFRVGITRRCGDLLFHPTCVIIFRTEAPLRKWVERYK